VESYDETLAHLRHRLTPRQSGGQKISAIPAWPGSTSATR
jgi:hypothetical protein